ncbi:hypothetical protein VF21_09877 [Pseudogymnoascus sp. 05NY08]|nr:hypothetical protein VF21_09877 [Pseudogymnoascus sp. 05NY08]
MSPTPQPARIAEPGSLGRAPGTVLLEDIHRGHAVLLQPQPSDDPNDPLNWSQFRKFLNFFIAAFCTMMITALLNISPIIWQDYNTELGISYPNLNNAFAANCAGLAVGCLIFIPFALKYGRRPVYIVSAAITFITAIWQALLRDLPNMMATQVISGMSGAVCDVVVQMTVADVFFLHQRGTMNAFYLFFFAAGAYLAPIAAGFIANQEGWCNDVRLRSRHTSLSQKDYNIPARLEYA